MATEHRPLARPAAEGPALELVNVFLTMQCNLRCTFCSSSSNLERQESMSWPRLEQIAVELRKIEQERGTLPSVRLTGGEPLLYPRFRDAVELFTFAPEINITTNGTLVTGELLAFFAAHPVTLNLSVYPDLPGAPFEGIRSPQTVRRILASDVPTLCTLVVHRENMPRLEALCDRLESWGAKTIVLNGVQPGGQEGAEEGTESLLLDDEQVTTLRAFARGRRGCRYVFREPPTPARRSKLDEEVPHCRCGEGHLSVLTDGTVTPCNSLHACKAGAIDDGLSAVYGSPVMEFVRRLRGLVATDFEPCRTCPDRPRCRIGSRVHAYLRTGDWLAIDPHAPCADRHERLAFVDEGLSALHARATGSRLVALRRTR